MTAHGRVRNSQCNGAWPLAELCGFMSCSVLAVPSKTTGMKFAVPLLAFACLAIANGQATTSESDEIKEHLIKLEKQSWEAWKNRDGEFFQNFLSDDHVEVGFGGLTSKAEVVAFVGSPVCTVKSYNLDRFEMPLPGICPVSRSQLGNGYLAGWN